MTAAKSATTRMINDRIGQAIQNDAVGNPSSQKVVTMSSSNPVTTANPASQSPRHRADAEPTVVVNNAADM